MNISILLISWVQPSTSKKHGIVFCQFQLKLVLEKADISIQYFDDIEPFEETSFEEQMVDLTDGMSGFNENNINEFIHIDNPTSKDFTEAMMDDINDVVAMINNNHCLEEELEDEVEKQDDIFDLPSNATTISKFQQAFDKIAVLGQKSCIHPWSTGPMEIMVISWQCSKT